MPKDTQQLDAPAFCSGTGQRDTKKRSDPYHDSPFAGCLELPPAYDGITEAEIAEMVENPPSVAK